MDFWAFPEGSGFPLYLLLRGASQQDVASIPNALQKYYNL